MNTLHPDVIREDIVSISIKDCLESFIEMESNVLFNTHDYLDSFFFASASGSSLVVKHLLNSDRIPLNSSFPGIIQSVLNKKFDTYNIIRDFFKTKGFKDSQLIPYLLFTISDEDLFAYLHKYDIFYSSSELNMLKKSVPTVLYDRFVRVLNKVFLLKSLNNELSGNKTNYKKAYKV